MKERIKKYMDHKGINAGELALSLEVQRSNISHILNGRNKPGAAFIEKMLLVYPDLNARWLLTGMGDMLGNAPKPVIETSAPMPRKEAPPKVEVKETIKKEPAEDRQKKEHNTNHDKEPVRFTTEAVEKVILLYKDGTFKTFDNRSKD